MLTPTHSLLHLSYLFLTLPLVLSASPCECGYTLPLPSSSSGEQNLFTDILETDFLHLRSLSPSSSAWLSQDYSMTSAQSRGPYGMRKDSTNLVPNNLESPWDWAGQGKGLELWVRSAVEEAHEGEQYVSTAEIVSARDDILYGSFRIAMQTSTVAGTCAAFFVYRNDTEEIDVEILSSEQQQKPSPNVSDNSSANASFLIHLISRSGPSVAYKIHNITPFLGPAENYNEYRVDWLPTSLSFLLNGVVIWSTNESIPSSPGRLHISHWSNGNAGWSGGPPRKDAVAIVSYVKAYFNSSDAWRWTEWVESTTDLAWNFADVRNRYNDKGCASDGVVGKRGCLIPDQKFAPNPFGAKGNETAKTFFFSPFRENATDPRHDGISKSTASKTLLSETWVAAVLWAWILRWFVYSVLR